jgi:outer membrane protein OmpA-like peptidoglycan-associated protein
MKRSIGEKFSGYAVLGSLAVLVFSCASAPEQIDSIAEARAAVERVERMPLAGEVAAQEIDAAHASLREAETLARKNKSSKDIGNAAYMAKRHAEIAEQQIGVAQAKRTVEQAEKERQAVLLAAREEEAARKSQEAEMSARKADAATKEADEAKRRMELLQEELAHLNARKTERGLVLTLGDVLFDTGQSTLKPGAMANIDRLAKFMNESPEHTVAIEGHTDSVGTDEYNQGLSERRADAVRQALTARGVTGDRVKAIGKGEAFPVASNADSGGRQQNRRVDIIIENPESRSAATIE